MSSKRLALTWFNQDKALLPLPDGGYEWVEPDDSRVTEVRLLSETGRVGEVTGTAADNLLIVGDSYDALHALTSTPEYADQYKGKVKLVYLDPPFNTGQTFEHYDDNFDHSLWLTLFRDRMKLLKELLADDGSIWVHLDDVEAHRAKLVMDEVFGPENFVTSFVWRKVDSPNENNSSVTPDHENLLVYGRGVDEWKRKQDPTLIRAYGQVDEETGRRFRDRLLKKNGKNSLRSDRPTMWYPIAGPDGTEIYPIHDDGREARWGASEKTVKSLIEQDLLIWKQRDDGAGGLKWVPYTREWAPDEPERPWSSIWSDLPTTRQAKAHLKSLGLVGFDTPKPEQLLQRIIEIASNPGDVVMDSYLGSGTTAAVAHKLGRRWIAIEASSTTVEQFSLPRLGLVVGGKDQGGITVATERVVADGVELPDGISPKDAQAFQTVLNKVLKGFVTDEGDDEAEDDEGVGPDPVTLTVDLAGELAKLVRVQQKDGQSSMSEDEAKTLLSLLKKVTDPELDVTKTVKSQLGKATKTKDEVTVHWHGGGGFRVLKVADPITETAGGRVFIKDGVVNLDEFVAAQLGYALNADRRGVTGTKHRDMLVVVHGMVDEEQVDFAVSLLNDDETVTLAGLAVHPNAHALLSRLRIGSRIVKVPNGLVKKLKVVR